MKKNLTTYREFFEKQDKKTRLMVLLSGLAILLFIVLATSLPIRSLLNEYILKYITKAATVGYGSGGYSSGLYSDPGEVTTGTPSPTPSGTPSVITNLLLNPSFEGGLNAWNFDDAESSVIIQSTRTGANAVRVGSPTLDGYVGQFVSLEPGKTYTATAWLKKSNTSTALASFGPVFRNGQTVIGENTVPVADNYVGGYTQASTTFTVPAEATSTQVGLFVDNGDVTVDIDDVEVFDPEAPAPTTSPSETQADTTISLLPASGSTNQNQTFTMSVNVDTGANSIVNADVFLTFNPAVLEVTDLSLGSFLTGAQEIEENIDNTGGNVSYSFYTTNENAKSGEGTIAQVTFRGKGGGSSNITFDEARTIVYGIGSGNVVSEFVNATRTVIGATPTPSPTTAPLTPTPTTVPPTPTRTPTPTVAGPTPTFTPTNTPSPTPVPCTITQAQWVTGQNPVTEGTTVQLRATTSGNCTGRQVSFEIFEEDTLGSDPVTNNPANASVTSGTATTSWSAEYQEDGGGMVNLGSPEYYFNATLVGAGATVRSQSPLLEVTKSTALLTFLIKLQGLLSTIRPIDAQITLRSLVDSTQDIKTVGLTTTVQNNQVAQFSTAANPGNYEVTIVAPGRLRKKVSFTLAANTSQVDLTNSLLIAGDVNMDNVINTLDIGQTIEDYSPVQSTTSNADLTRDGFVNALDIGYIIENYFKHGN